MTTIHYLNNGTALFYEAIIINPKWAVASGSFARFGLADLAHALNSDKPNGRLYARFFATAEERDDFIANHNKEASE
jgi:hypothetical protein